VTASIKAHDGVMHVTGELNFATVMDLWRDSLAKLAELTAVDIDLSQVKTSNSAGLALLLAWLKYAEKCGKSVTFKHIPAHLASIIKVSGTEKILKMNI
jgi:phospholipid transport system transporter-binding protein